MAPLRCQVKLSDLLTSYFGEARNAGFTLLPEENYLSAFCPSKPALERGKWDPGIGSSWFVVQKGGEVVGEMESQGEGEDAQEQEGEDPEAPDQESMSSDPEEGHAVVKRKGRRRKHSRGSGSRLSRKRSGKDIRSAGSNAAARKARIAEKWTRKGSFYRTNGYSLLHDGSHTSTGWQGLAPPLWKRKQVQEAYDNGSIVDVLGNFFPVPYEM